MVIEILFFSISASFPYNKSIHESDGFILEALPYVIEIRELRRYWNECSFQVAESVEDRFSPRTKTARKNTYESATSVGFVFKKFGELTK